MKHDTLLCGVGGQGILSVAYVLDQSALEAGYFLKQPEVHGMSQRGGAVQAQVRVSNEPLASELISLGQADLILALEPLESLRYVRFLSPERGWLVADITPFANISDYPDPLVVCRLLLELPAVVLVNGAHLARKAGSPKTQNMIVLGAAIDRLPYPPESLEKHTAALFAPKGERIVHINLNALRMGAMAARFHRVLLNAGIATASASRVLPWLDFDPWPVPEPVCQAWLDFFQQGGSGAVADRLWSERVVLPLDEEAPRKLYRGVSPRDLEVSR